LEGIHIRGKSTKKVVPVPIPFEIAPIFPPCISTIADLKKEN
jgi:hypothetical protein